MNDITEKEENSRIKVLMDIYRNENEQLKTEYRVLYDKYVKETDTLKNEYVKLYDLYKRDIEKYENSLSFKIAKFFKKSVIYKVFKRMKKLFNKKG